MRPNVVEADVELRARLAGNDIDGRIADVDRAEFEIGAVEMRRARVEFMRGERRDDARDDRRGIFGAMRIGDMALLADDANAAIERAAPPDLDRVAERRDIRRLADDAMIELFAARPRPVEQLHRAVDRRAFLVAGDEKGERALRRAAPLDIGQRRGDEGGDGAFHVRGAAAVDSSVRDFRRERIEAPARDIARGHDVGVASEGEMRMAGSDRREEIVHIGRRGFREGQPMRLKTRRLQRAFDDIQARRRPPASPTDSE